MSLVAVIAMSVGVLARSAPADGLDSASWIWSEGTGIARVFRNVFTNSAAATASVDVSADTHYVLKFDGRIVGRGPDLSVPDDWACRTYELPVSPGRHEIESVVYHGGSMPYGMPSYRAGFFLKGYGDFDAVLSTGKSQWRAADIKNVSYGGKSGGAFGVGLPNIVRGSSPELTELPEDAFGPVVVVREGLDEPSPYYHELPGWRLTKPKLPRQTSRVFHAPGVRFPISVPANGRREIVVALGDYYCAYPILSMSGGRGAVARLGWSESKRRLDNGQAYEDTFLPAGGASRFTTSRYRCGTVCRLCVETKDDPVEVLSLDFEESFYPLDLVGHFSCNDDTIDSVVRLCRRGLQMCAHEGVYDCPFYEQLVYIGDTRIQFLAQNAVSSDDCLQKRVLELFARSAGPDGIMPMNYPCTGPCSRSATYTLIYPLELKDFMMWHDDFAWLLRQLPALAATMEGIASFENADGLLENLPGWCFVDWAEWTPGGAHLGAGPEAGRLSCIENLLYVLALEAAGQVADAVGRSDLAAVYAARRQRVVDGVVSAFWSEETGAFADDCAHNRYSEHAQSLAIAAGVLDADRRARCLSFLVGAHGLTRTSVYFSHYLFDAYGLAGRSDLILKRLDLWRDYVRKGYSTPLEMPEPSRSDCHGWGAHPLYHLATHVAGIRPDAPGFSRVRVAPQPAGLHNIDCRVPHPRGFVDVMLDFADDSVQGFVSLPDEVEGTFLFREVEMPLHSGTNRISRTLAAPIFPEAR